MHNTIIYLLILIGIISFNTHLIKYQHILSVKLKTSLIIIHCNTLFSIIISHVSRAEIRFLFTHFLLIFLITLSIIWTIFFLAFAVESATSR